MITILLFMIHIIWYSITGQQLLEVSYPLMFIFPIEGIIEALAIIEIMDRNARKKMNKTLEELYDDL